MGWSTVQNKMGWLLARKPMLASSRAQACQISFAPCPTLGVESIVICSGCLLFSGRGLEVKLWGLDPPLELSLSRGREAREGSQGSSRAARPRIQSPASLGMFSLDARPPLLGSHLAGGWFRRLVIFSPTFFAAITTLPAFPLSAEPVCSSGRPLPALHPRRRRHETPTRDGHRPHQKPAPHRLAPAFSLTHPSANQDI